MAWACSIRSVGVVEAIASINSSHAVKAIGARSRAITIRPYLAFWP